MNDLEMTILCAEAMGLMQTTHYDDRVPSAPDPAILVGKPHCYEIYDPLHDDAQAMALVKKFKLNIGQLSNGCKVFIPITGNRGQYFEADFNADLNRAIVECVAKMWAQKVPRGT